MASSARRSRSRSRAQARQEPRWSQPARTRSRSSSATAFRSSAWSRRRRICSTKFPTWGFDRVKDAAQARWNEALGQHCGRGRHGSAAQGLLHRALSLLRAHDQHHRRRPLLQRFDHQVHRRCAPVLCRQLALGYVSRAGAAADAAESGDAGGQDPVLCAHVSAVGNHAHVRARVRATTRA